MIIALSPADNDNLKIALDTLPEFLDANPDLNGLEIMRNPSKPHADKFRSDTITPHVKCQIHLIRPYASCNRRSKN